MPMLRQSASASPQKKSKIKPIVEDGIRSRCMRRHHEPNTSLGLPPFVFLIVKG